jgi:hypothetical protein
MNLLSTPLTPHSWGEKGELRDTLRLPAGGVLHFLPPRKGAKCPLPRWERTKVRVKCPQTLGRDKSLAPSETKDNRMVRETHPPAGSALHFSWETLPSLSSFLRQLGDNWMMDRDY